MDGVCVPSTHSNTSAFLPIFSLPPPPPPPPTISLFPCYTPRNAITVGIFYGLPAVQFVLGQQLVRLYQWHTLCYVSCMSTLSTDSLSHWLPGIVLLQLWVFSPIGGAQVTVMWPLVPVKWCIFYCLCFTQCFQQYLEQQLVLSAGDILYHNSSNQVCISLSICPSVCLSTHLCIFTRPIGIGRIIKKWRRILNFGLVVWFYDVRCVLTNRFAPVTWSTAVLWTVLCHGWGRNED